ncbi:MAG: hypothetical protein AB7L41_05725 [Flavobacteriaceae bacterium]
MRISVAFQCHRFNAEMTRRFEVLRDCAAALSRGGVRYDVRVLADAAGEVPSPLAADAHRFRFEELRAMMAETVGDTLVPGNNHLAMLDFAAAHPDYDRYWFVEYDVVRSGGWAAFFRAFEAEDADFLSTRLRRIADEPGWYWRGSLATGSDTVADEARLFAFMPICRLSREALAATRTACARGWTGHYEALVPTAVAAAGLAVSDIGGGGPFVPLKRRHRHYIEAAVPVSEEMEFLSTFRWRPPVRRKPVAGLLYHPDKGGVRAVGNPDLSLWRAFRREPVAVAAYFARLAVRAVTSRLSGSRA